MSRRLTLEEVLLRFHEKHGDEFDYLLVDYKGMRIPVDIICPKGHIFQQTPESHLRGSKCNICANNQRKNNDHFIQDAKEVWGDLYDLSKVQYVNWRTPIKIGCSTHGFVDVIPNNFLRGHGCGQCGIEVRNLVKVKSKKEFIEDANIVHHGYYNYDEVDYKGCFEPVLIGCPKGHKFWQSPDKHLQGHGCTICNQSHGETRIMAWLDDNNIEYISQYQIALQSLLFHRNLLRADFYLPRLKIVIEYHGEQHFFKINFFHKDDDAFQMQVDRDNRLREYCKQNKIKLIEIPYTDIDKIPQILSKKIGRC